MICEHAYARGSMLTHAFDLAGDHRAAFSVVPVGNQIDYLRLAAGPVGCPELHILPGYVRVIYALGALPGQRYEASHR
jgi:hypothetical protein